MKSTGLPSALVVLVIAVVVERLADSYWLRFPAAAIALIALLAIVLIVVEIIGRGAYRALRILATGGFALLYGEKNIRSRRPPAGTWRNILYTGGLGVFQPSGSDEKEVSWSRNR